MSYQTHPYLNHLLARIATPVTLTLNRKSPPVIDLTSDYEYAAMFDEQLDEILSDEDETNILPTSSEHKQGLDPQPTAKKILRNLVTIINFDEISKFNISRSNLWESAVRGFNRKSFSH